MSNTPLHQPLKVGTLVTTAYREYKFDGTVLAVDDPRAWSCTLAFPYRIPTQKEATAQARYAQTIPSSEHSESVPVLWNFSASGYQDKIYWESVNALTEIPDSAQRESLQRAYMEARNG